MYKTNVNNLITDLKQEIKDELLKEIIINFRKYGNNYELGKEVRTLIIKKIGDINEDN